jgi:hypothetical protein
MSRVVPASLSGYYCELAQTGLATDRDRGTPGHRQLEPRRITRIGITFDPARSSPLTHQRCQLRVDDGSQSTNS